MHMRCFGSRGTVAIADIEYSGPQKASTSQKIFAAPIFGNMQVCRRVFGTTEPVAGIRAPNGHQTAPLFYQRKRVSRR